jgi:hypothetical protein
MTFGEEKKSFAKEFENLHFWSPFYETVSDEIYG